MKDQQFENIVNEIKRDHPIQLLTGEENDIHLNNFYIIEPDVSFKRHKEIEYIEFSLVFGLDSKLWGPEGEVELTKKQKLFLQAALDTACYNDERHEI